MLALKIIATIFLAFSFITCALKNYNTLDDSTGDICPELFATFYGWSWRAFCIVALWMS